MESLGKDHAYSDSSLSPSAAHEEYAVPDVIITRRLRDREQLRKRRAEAQERDSAQWVLSREQTKRQRRGRKARRGRGRRPVVEIKLEREPKLDPQPNSQEEAEPVPSESAAPSEPVHQEQPPMLTFQDMISGMQPGVVERELAAESQDPAGEEEMLKLAEAEVPEAWNIPLENEHQDNECSTHFLF